MKNIQKFRSKIGLELVIPIAFVLLSVLALSAFQNPGWAGTLIISPIAILIAYIFMSTLYKVDGQQLIVECGFFYKSKIDIQSIKKISETNNPLSSPATSLDRLEIVYGENKSVLISPKEKTNFIQTLQSLNPNIEVKLKS